MSMSPINLRAILGRLCAVESIPELDELTDRELLSRFASHRDEDAFALIVRRHGAMVLGVAQRFLRDEHEVEDIFQATFLVLARKADSGHWHNSIAHWLYEVAQRLALEARSRITSREVPTAYQPPVSEHSPAEEVDFRDLCAVLDEEVSALSVRFREPLLLCYWQGETRDRTAKRLNLSLRTLDRRLEQARAILRGRLARRGVTFPAALLSADWFHHATATPSERLMSATIQSSLMGQSSTRAMDLAAVELSKITSMKLKQIVAILVLVSVTVGGGGLTYAWWSSQPPKPQAASDRNDTKSEDSARPANENDPNALPEGAVARLGSLKLRHEGEAGSVAFSPDGKIVAATSRSGQLSFWSTATGDALPQGKNSPRDGPQLPPPDESNSASIGAVAFSPDGKVLAWIDVRGREILHIWDLTKGRELFRIDPKSKFLLGQKRLCFSPDGKMLALAGSRPVKVWNVKNGQKLVEVGNPRASTKDLAFSPDGKILALATSEPGLQLWDVTTGKLIRGVDFHHSDTDGVKWFAMAVAFSPDGKIMASAGRKEIVISRVSDSEDLLRIEKSEEWIHRLVFTPDGKSLMAGGEDGKIRIYDVVTGIERRVLVAGRRLGVRSVAFSRDGEIAAMGSTSPKLHLWNTTTGEKLFLEAQAHDGPVRAVEYSPDGKFLVTSDERQQILLWEGITGDFIRELGGPHNAWSVCFSPDSQWLITANKFDNTARVWDLTNGKAERQLIHHDADYLTGIAYTPDGNTIVSLSGGYKQNPSTDPYAQLHLWDTHTAELRRSWRVSPINIRPDSLAVSQDGRFAAVSGYLDFVTIYDLARGEEVRKLRSGVAQNDGLAFSPDGSLLAIVGKDRVTRVYELVTGEQIFNLGVPVNPPVVYGLCPPRVAFSPNGRLIAATSGNDVIRLWDLATGKQLPPLQGHQSMISALAFSPDGRRLVSGARNSSVLIWDPLRGKPLPPLTLTDLETAWRDLASSDGQRAYAVTRAMIDHPEKSIPFLKDHLQPVAKIDPKAVEQLITDLASANFRTRETATKELHEMALQILPELRRVAKETPSAEVRRRVEGILASIKNGPPPEVLRGIRAIRVLQSVNSRESRAILRTLAEGAPEARVTMEAKAAVGK